MTLPKKYAGVTEGPWSEGDDVTGADLPNRNEVWRQIVADGMPFALVRNALIDDDQEANALLISDAPRLAAEMVKMREAFARITSLSGAQVLSTGKDRVTSALDALDDARDIARAALESSKEWEA